MSYAAAPPGHDTNAKLIPAGTDPVVARMVRDLRVEGSIVVDLDVHATAAQVESARVLLMNELCEPVTAEVQPGRIVFRRAWAK